MPLLWQCLVNLRSEADAHILPHPEKVRRTKKKLNWHNISERQASIIRTICGLPAKRTSRAQAWRNLNSSIKKSCSWKERDSELATGLIVLFVPPQSARAAEWQVGLILTVWRYTAHKQKKTGAKPCTMPIPMQVARYARIAQMHPCSSGSQEGIFEVSAASPTIVCDVGAIAFFLPTTEISQGIDGLRAKLSPKALEAIRLARAFDEWPEELMLCQTLKARSAKRKAHQKIDDAIIAVADSQEAENDEGENDENAEMGTKGSKGKPEKQKKTLLKQLHAKAKTCKKIEEIPVACFAQQYFLVFMFFTDFSPLKF